MPNYKIHIENRYETWRVFRDDTYDEVEYSIDPMSCKMFSDDVFNDDDNITILHSTTRHLKSIPGILVLDKNKRIFLKFLNLKKAFNVRIFFKE